MNNQQELDTINALIREAQSLPIEERHFCHCCDGLTMEQLKNRLNISQKDYYTNEKAHMIIHLLYEGRQSSLEIIAMLLRQNIEMQSDLIALRRNSITPISYVAI